MPRIEKVSIPLAGLTVTDAQTGAQTDLGQLPGVHILVLMRHRH